VGHTTISDPQLGRERQQARDALAHWADAVAAAGGQQALMVVGDRTGQVGDWELPVGSNNKMALMAGQVVAAIDLSDETPAPAEVHWQDGSVRTLPTMSAAQALRDLHATADEGSCPECESLKVTGAKLMTAQLATSRGPATVPVWEFSLQGTSVRITRVAIAASATVNVVAPVWDPDDPPVGLSIYAASGTADGMELTVFFVGSPKTATQPCGVDYEAEAVESVTAVVAIVIEHSNPTPGACEAVGATRTATLRLAAPVGDRALLEVKEGLPVPVTLAP
jgi:hypothetical protein